MLLFITINRSGRPYSHSFRSSFSLGQLGEGLLWCKFLAVSKEVAKSNGWFHADWGKACPVANCVFCVNPCTDTEKASLSDSVTKLITANIAIIKSGHNLSSDLKKLRYNLHTVEMQCYTSVILPNADTCVIHILCQDSKHFHLLGKFPRPSSPLPPLFLQATTFVIPCIMVHLIPQLTCKCSHRNYFRMELRYSNLNTLQLNLLFLFQFSLVVFPWETCFRYVSVSSYLEAPPLPQMPTHFIVHHSYYFSNLPVFLFAPFSLSVVFFQMWNFIF